MKESFSVGVYSFQSTPAHPRCRCNIGYVYDSGDGKSVARAKRDNDEILKINEAVQLELDTEFRGKWPNPQTS